MICHPQKGQQMRALLALAAALAILATQPADAVRAQTPEAASSINIFLDCQASGCDTSHFRTEIAWVNWVRDRTAADVHLLITSEGTGSGGTSYNLTYMGM